MEKQSRQKETFLDVKGVDAKESLDKPAGILIVMLGMNDSLSPYIGQDSASLDNWAKQYKTLVGALRERAKPRVVGLGTITPNTEDPKSPKNLLVAEMNKRLAGIALELGCVILPTGETVVETLRKGRSYKPDFHVTYDFVHPNQAGQASIAVGMLKGLGEKAAAEKITSKYLDKEYAAAKGAAPTLSYTIAPTSMPLDSNQASFDVAYFWTPAAEGKGDAKATLSVPSGWKAEPTEISGASGVFKVTGNLDRLVNILKLTVNDSGSSKESEIKIPAPWLVGCGFANQAAWELPKQNYTPEKGVLPSEEQWIKGLGFGKTPEGWKGDAPKWVKYLASVDHTGGNSPGNVSLYAASFANPFECAFGVRWIKSEKELPVKLTMGTQVFAGAQGVCVFLNGEKIYSGTVNTEPERKVVKDAILRKGWNCLVFKANHCTWQWQFSAELTADKPEDLAALTFSTVPPSVRVP